MATVQRVRKINLGTILIFSHRFDPVYKIKYAKSSYKEDDVHLKHALFPRSDRRIRFDIFFLKSRKVHAKRKPSIKKKVQSGTNQSEKVVFAALLRPIATRNVRQKNILAHTLISPDVINKMEKELTPKDQHREDAVQKRCDSEMAMGKNSAQNEKGSF